MDSASIAVHFPSGGVSTARHPVTLGANQLADATNIGLSRDVPCTRPGIRVLELEGVDFGELNLQGATRYNPSEGQSIVSFGSDESSIVLAAGGRKFKIKPDKHSSSRRACVEEITDDCEQDPTVHLVWLYQAENYIIGGDGSTSTWIYDSANGICSPGYDSENRDNSFHPNQSTAGVYAHGQIHTTDQGQVVIGDAVGTATSSSGDIVSFTDQQYFGTSIYLTPPSNFGAVNAMTVQPTPGRSEGLGDLVYIHADNGIYASKAASYAPRTSWATQRLTCTVLPGDSARGPYAHDNVIIDPWTWQVFRGKGGIRLLRGTEEGGIQTFQISDPMYEGCLKKDREAYLRFTSVATWQSEHRIMTTVGPIVRGNYRASSGIASYNFKPGSVEGIPSGLWEGLWVMPPELAHPVQMVRGDFGGEDRMFLFAYGRDGILRLAEFQDRLKEDILSDGTRRPISSQMITRVMDGNSFFSSTEWLRGTLYLDEVDQDTQWGVWVREKEGRRWIEWHTGKINTTCPPADCPADIELNRDNGMDCLALPLGEVPEEIKNPRTMQVLIRFRGHACLQGVRVYSSEGDDKEGETAKAEECIVANRQSEECTYSRFENAYDDNRWESDLLANSL